MRATMWACLVLCLILATLGAAAMPPDVLYPVDVVVSTTSDWTDVRVFGATWVASSYVVVEGLDAPGLRVEAGPLAVSKTLLDETPVTVRFTGYLAEFSSSSVRIRIHKGHLGNTSVSIFPAGRADGEPFVRCVHRGVVPGAPEENARTFSFRVSDMTSQVEPVTIPAPSDTSIGGRKVLSFYYPWYGTPDGPSGRWVHWEPGRSNYASTHVPAAGYYDSQDPETLRRHIREAKAAGIDGFIVSWWGLGTFEDRAFRTLLEVAEEEEFLVTVYYEDAPVAPQIVTDVSTILFRHGSSPAFLRVDGAPVIFFYVRVTAKFSLAQWETVFASLRQRGEIIFAVADSLDPAFLQSFQGLHTYNPVSIPLEQAADQYKSASLAARLQGALFAATVLPGYEEAAPRWNSPSADRDEGATYQRYWEVARASKPHWILITSFNEWHEGSEIEPSIEFGTRYIEQTAAEAAAWREGEAVSNHADSTDRDGDGVADADDYCPDWPGSPEANGC